MVKINIGDVLDCNGNWKGALGAFEESYRYSSSAEIYFLESEVVRKNLNILMDSELP